jgi:dipeptidyl aminopeptidase/acylaminoacyl peptidase
MRQACVLATLVSLIAAPAQAQTPPAQAPAGRRELGNLVLDGLPDLPPRIAERTNQYQNTRGARLLDWDPAGKGMLVATRFGEVPQVHYVAAPGGDRAQLTFYREPVTEAVFDPKQGSGGFVFRMDQGGGEFYQYYWYDRATGKHTLLTDGKSRNETLLPARGGGKFAFVSTQRNGKDFDVYVMTGTRAEGVKRVKETAGQWAPIDWSPDDKRLILGREVSINESYLYVLDPASGEMKEVNSQPGKKIAYRTAAFAPGGNSLFYASDEDSEFTRLTRFDLQSGKKTVLTPKLDWDVELVAVSRDGRHLAWVANEGGTSGLYLALAAQPQRARKIPLPKGVIGALLFDRQSKRLGLSISGAQFESDVYAVDVASGKLTRWTFSEVGGLDPRSFVEPELVEYPSFDKKKIPAWYYRPKRPPGKPLPVIISIHGGPEAQAVVSFSAILQYMATELGAAVLAPNVRGSSGYGKSYLLLDNAERREDSVKDIGALLDWIATRPELDKTRVAVIGGSYGGFMVLASMIAYGDRLRCGVDTVGISNFVTFLQNTEDYRRDLRRAEYGDERDPKMKDLLVRISPMTNAARIKKPLFVVQGLNDPRVPISEAEQIVRTVRKNGGTVWYLVARDEGHGFQKKANRDFYQNAFLYFFERYLVE